MNHERLDWLDIARGIAIILVVYGHAARGLGISGLISFDGAWGYVDYLIYTVHMPVFFVVSGFVYERGRIKNRDARSFWIDKIVTIAWPYFLWTSIHVSIQSVLSGTGMANNDNASLERLLTIGWNPVSPFWFLYALFVAFLISFFLQRIAIRTVTVASFVVMLLVYWFDTPPLLHDLTYGLVYFSLGRLVYAEQLSNIPQSKLLLAVAAICFVSISTIAYRIGMHPRLETIGTLAGLVTFCLLSKMLAGTMLNRPLVVLGRFTMGIYVMHIFVIAAFRAVSIKILHLGPSATIIGCTILAVILPMIAQAVANMLGVAKFVGLKTKI